MKTSCRSSLPLYFRLTLFSLALIGFFGLPSVGQAQTFRVLKVNSNRAVIELPRGITLDKGKTYAVETDSSSELSLGTGGTSAHAIGLSFSFTNGTYKRGTSYSYSVVESKGYFLLNKGKLEYGPYVFFTYDNFAGAYDRTIGAGGMVDFNLVPASGTKPLVYGLSGSLGVGLAAQGSSTTSTSGTVVELYGGGQIKWFPFGPAVALRGDLGFLYNSNSAYTPSLNLTALRAQAGLQAYF